MKIGILSTGIVERTISSKLVELGRNMKIGSRTTKNEKAVDWFSSNGPNATHSTSEEAGAFGDNFFK